MTFEELFANYSSYAAVVAAVLAALVALYKAPNLTAKIALARRYAPVVIAYWPKVKPAIDKIVGKIKGLLGRK